MVRVPGLLARNARDIAAPALVGGGVLGAAEVTRRPSRKRKAGALAAGGAGFAGYKGTGFAIRAQGIKAERTLPEGLTRSQRTKILDDHRKPLGVRHGQNRNIPPEFYRSYPKKLPGWKYKRALGHMSGVRGRVLEAGAITLPSAAVLHNRQVHKSGRSFLRAGVLTGAAGAGTAGGLRATGHHDDAETVAAGTVGSWAGQGAYQGAGYGAKWRAQANKEPLATRSQRDKHLKPVKRAHGAYTPAMERNYPKSLPEWRTHRTLGWTHRGRTGTAVGAAATTAGALLAARGVREPMRNNDGGHGNRLVHKGDLQWHERKQNRRKQAQVAVGGTLIAAGVPRIRMIGDATARGMRSANPRTRTLSAHAEQLRAGTERGTAPLVSRVQRLVHRNKGVGGLVELVPPRLRPFVAAGAGETLIRRALPTREDTYRPVVGRPMYGG